MAASRSDQHGVNGVNQQCHIVCNPLYTVFFTTANKDRLSVLDVLRNLAARTFCFNAEAFALLHTLGVAQRVIVQVQALPQEQTLSEAALTALLDQLAPPLGPLQRQHVLEAAAVAAYHAQLEFPVIQLLVCDDAPQFNWLTAQLALCWVHEGRHYKKLTPCVPHHQQLLAEFQKQFWDFYDDLLAYRAAPSPAEKVRLTAEFERIFAMTGYQQLDAQLPRRNSREPACCSCSTIPIIPLHNNPADWVPASVCANAMSALAADHRWRPSLGHLPNFDGHRPEAGREHLPLHPRSRHPSLRATQLASLIAERAQQAPLGQSWAAT